MKKTILGLVLGVMALVLAGCADHYPAYLQQAQKTDETNKAMVASYFGAQSARDAAIFSSMKDNPTALVMYGFMQGDRDAKLVNSMKGSVIERPKNGWDIADTFWGNTMPTLIRWGAGYLIAGDLLDALGAGVTVGGDYVNYNNTAGGDLNTTFSYSPSDFNAGDDINIDSLNTTN